MSPPILLNYGAEFADFVVMFPPAHTLTYLADVTRIERAWTEAYHATEISPIHPDQLAANIAADQFGGIVLELHPSSREGP